MSSLVNSAHRWRIFFRVNPDLSSSRPGRPSNAHPNWPRPRPGPPADECELLSAGGSGGAGGIAYLQWRLRQPAGGLALGAEVGRRLWCNCCGGGFGVRLRAGAGLSDSPSTLSEDAPVLVPPGGYAKGNTTRSFRRVTFFASAHGPLHSTTLLSIPLSRTSSQNPPLSPLYTVHPSRDKSSAQVKSSLYINNRQPLRKPTIVSVDLTRLDLTLDLT